MDHSGFPHFLLRGHGLDKGPHRPGSVPLGEKVSAEVATGKEEKGIFHLGGGYEGAMLTVKYFFDALGVDLVGQLLFKGVEAKGDIRNHPTALQEAFEAGKALVNGRTEGSLEG